MILSRVSGNREDGKHNNNVNELPLRRGSSTRFYDIKKDGPRYEHLIQQSKSQWFPVPWCPYFIFLGFVSNKAIVLLSHRRPTLSSRGCCHICSDPWEVPAHCASPIGKAGRKQPSQQLRLWGTGMLSWCWGKQTSTSPRGPELTEDEWKVGSQLCRIHPVQDPRPVLKQTGGLEGGKMQPGPG